MKNIGQLFLGLLTALSSSLLVLAAASLALLEGNAQIIPQISTPALPTYQTKPAISSPLQDTPIPAPLTSTPACPYPVGWVSYTILGGDTLQSLAQSSGTTPETLYVNNCLESQSLVAGSRLYLPPPSTPTITQTPGPGATLTLTVTVSETPTPEKCGPPQGWIPYIVKIGDNLYRIGLAYNVTVDGLKHANCLVNDYIQTGQRLFVPNVPPRVPTATYTPTKEPPPPAKTPTQKPPQPTAEPTTEPTARPTVDPTVDLSPEPTVDPTADLPLEPTAEPTAVPPYP